ncbi:MAG: FAD-dependent oxidoreductase [Sphingomonadales bacterium]|nr:FAD-dependent oxidoreductase [Sphingomonadales bacterium]
MNVGTRPLKNLSEVIVIGGGLAGLAAARHMARLGRLVTLFEGSGLYGGLTATLGHVDGLPFPGTFAGQDLAIPLLEDARKVGVRVIEWSVDKVENGDRLTVTDGAGDVHRPEAVIVASGASLRQLGVPGEEQLLGRGVSRCATCDGGFYKGKDVAVIGAGDGAVHEALTLVPLARTVYLVARSPLSAKREYADRIAGKDNVRFVWESEVTAILGDQSVTGLALRDVNTGAESRIEVSGVFPFIGVEPVSGFLPEALRTPTGHVAAGADTATADPRIFAAGAVRAGYGGTVIEAMAEGVRAAESVARLLAGKF